MSLERPAVTKAAAKQALGTGTLLCLSPGKDPCLGKTNWQKVGRGFSFGPHAECRKNPLSEIHNWTFFHAPAPAVGCAGSMTGLSLLKTREQAWSGRGHVKLLTQKLRDGSVVCKYIITANGLRLAFAELARACESSLAQNGSRAGSLR